MQVYPDNSCKREVMNLRVKCNVASYGCQWTGKLSELDVSNAVEHTAKFTKSFCCRPLAHISKFLERIWYCNCVRILSQVNRQRLDWLKKMSDRTCRGGAVADRLRRRTSDQTVFGSNPAVAATLSPWTRFFTPIVPRRSLHISFY